MRTTIKINGQTFSGLGLNMRDVLYFLANNFNGYLINDCTKYAEVYFDGIKHIVNGDMVNWYLKSKATPEKLQQIARDQTV